LPVRVEEDEPIAIVRICYAGPRERKIYSLPIDKNSFSLSQCAQDGTTRQAAKLEHEALSDHMFVEPRALYQIVID
jgi:hypothetical protein